MPAAVPGLFGCSQAYSAMGGFSQFVELPGEKSEWIAGIEQSQINAAERQIDQLIYGLYGPTDKEIKIVEGEACVCCLYAESVTQHSPGFDAQRRTLGTTDPIILGAHKGHDNAAMQANQGSTRSVKRAEFRIPRGYCASISRIAAEACPMDPPRTLARSASRSRPCPSHSPLTRHVWCGSVPSHSSPKRPATSL